MPFIGTLTSQRSSLAARRLTEMIDKYLKHPVYWSRFLLSQPIMWIGFKIYDVGVFFCSYGNQIQELGISVEGEIPDGAL
jgi:hypothetical protein